LIASQQVDPSPREVFRRAIAASALHGETTRSTLNPAPMSGSSSGLTEASLRFAPSGSPQMTARHRRGSRNERRVCRTATVKASIPGNAAGSRTSAADRRTSARRTDVRANAQVSAPSSTAVMLAIF
jgi:hypothetical protein